MNYAEAKQQVEKVFNTEFKEENYRLFIRNLMHGCTEINKGWLRGAEIRRSFSEHIDQYKRVAKFDYGNDIRIDAIIVRVKSIRALANARTMQRNFVAWYLKESYSKNKDAALVAFYAKDCDDWRLSFVRMDYKYDKSKDEITTDITPAKRFSFLLGESEKTHTAQSRFAELLASKEAINIESLQKAFAIEPMTKEFFGEYKNLYNDLNDALRKYISKSQNKEIKAEFSNKNIKTEDFAKRLLGQIVFMYFLQKKGWLGVKKGERWGTGHKDFLRRLYNGEYDNYDNFFDGILEPLFYEALATERSDNYYDHLKCRIPFLNGGLFEPIGKYDWVNKDMLLDNAIFAKIFDTFDQYNFTVREDEPLDKEVAVDPEMLGMVFENLIPENERKGSGTYYTPREIVHYMCQSSLIGYLDSKINASQKLIPKSELEKFIYHSDAFQEHDKKSEETYKSKGKYTKTYSIKVPKSIKNNAKTLDKLLADIKVCDPAIGSGAFPVGLMNEIVRIRIMLDAYNLYNHNQYDLKRHAIKHSLHGADIESSAVDIAKLRLWLSLVVDEDNFDDIQPLPNLDYKIFPGDSLLGMKFDIFDGDKIDKFKDLKNEYFDETSRKKKDGLEKDIENILSELSPNTNKSIELYFCELFKEGSKGGFDIVIGNPPYIQLQKDGGLLANKYKNNKFETFTGAGDIYCLFYERALNIAATGGALCYITSNKWMQSGYGKFLRKFFCANDPQLLIDFGGHKVFETATVDTNILHIKKQKNRDKLIALKIKDDYKKGGNIADYVDKHRVQLTIDRDKPWFVGSKKELLLKRKIEKYGLPIKDWDVVVNRGILTCCNEAFIIDRAKRNELIRQDPNSKQIIKQILRGRDIIRYSYSRSGLFLIAVHNGYSKNTTAHDAVNINDYPAVKKHLDSYWDALEARSDQGGTVYNLRPCSYWYDFSKVKLVWGEITGKPSFTTLLEDTYINNKAYMMTGHNIKYLCGVLNSKCLSLYYPTISTNIDAGGKRNIKQIPVPAVTADNKKQVNQIEELVDKILAAKENNPDANTSALESKIDAIVYQLYKLSKEEIALVENLSN